MQNGLLKRYFLTCMAVVLASITILGTVFLFLAAQYFKGESLDQLDTMAEHTAEITEKVIVYDGSQYSWLGAKEDVMSLLKERYQGFTLGAKDSDIFLTTADGVTEVCTEDAPCAHTTYKISSKLLDKAFKDGSYRGMSTLGEIYKTSHYVVAQPVVKDGGVVVGYVFAASPAKELSTFLMDMLKMFGGAALLVILFSFVVIYPSTNRLVKPLREMAVCAQRFGKGDFSQKIPVTENDEMGQLAMSLNNMASSLAMTESVRRSFVANVSHELKTPMTTIGGFVDGILDHTIPPEKEDYYLRIVSTEVKRLSRLISGMLNVSKIEAGEMRLNVTTFNICDTVLAALLSFEQQIDKKHIDIQGLDVGKVMVQGDKDLLHQVIYNLVDNAVKFVNEGGQIRFAFSQGPGGTMVAIRNTGEGIPKEQMQQVFERFYKTDRSRSLDKKGVGLGLYIVKTIIARHGGDIVVSSKEGEYTEFKFSLPPAPKERNGHQKSKQQPGGQPRGTTAQPLPTQPPAGPGDGGLQP
ncbi:Sensor protein srrB [Anaerotruncus sp. 2789STDY5834896]|uniref:histidine kinase n=1 Tax=uncultured Anaerotruncus sp. TaxID=905011 RepID=A0A1C6JFD0_9FIRM|nr:Sensor protein srrB [uncultured Anaerotruncus sp.]